MKPILFEYFKTTVAHLQAQFARSAVQNASDNLGANREHFCNDFLKKILPPKLTVSSGEIWDSTDFKTGQVDTIIIRDDAPSLDFGSQKSYFAEGVFAAIEVKSNLTTSKLDEAASTFLKISTLKINPPISSISTGHDLGRPLKIVFAYKGAKFKTLAKHMAKKGYKETFDLICILDQGILIKKDLLFSTGNVEDFIKIDGTTASLAFMYFHLITYSAAFVGRNLDISPYFQPLGDWKDVV